MVNRFRGNEGTRSTIYNIIITSASVAVAREERQFRAQPRVAVALPAMLRLHDGILDVAVVGVPHPSGSEEVWIMATGHSDRLTAIAAEELDRSSFARVALTGPPGDLYGEGTSTYRAGIPSITTACGPTYLVQVSRDSGLHQLSFPLMAAQVDYCLRVTSRMLSSRTFD